MLGISDPSFQPVRRLSTLPFVLYLLWLAIATSALVLVEPAPVDILVILGLITALLQGLLSYNRAILFPGILLLIFVLANIISMFNLPGAERGLFYFAVTLYLILSFFLFAGVVTKFGVHALKIIFSAYIFASMLAACLGILAFIGVLPWQELIKFGRIEGTFKDPNLFGPFLVPTALYGLYKLESVKAIQRIWWVPVFFISTAGVLLSFSRAAWLNYLIALFLYLALQLITTTSIKKLGQRIAFLFAVTVPLLIGGLYLVDAPDVERLFFERLRLQAYDSDRFATQVGAIEIAMKTPLGIGPGQSELVFDYAAHSLYVRLMAENGWLGFLAFIGFCSLTLMFTLRIALSVNHPLQPVFALFSAVLVGILVNSLVIDSLHWRHFWLFLALPWATFSLGSEEHEKRPVVP